MAIRIDEVTIASKNIDRLKNFYSDLIDESDVRHHDFFYTLKDKSTEARVSIVPHNGQAKWNEPWITLSTDDLTAAIQKVKSVGITADKLEEFSAPDVNGNPTRGICFQDPDGRLVMMIEKS
jgi:predicted enzyme related to lactoylglutathione lyase